MLQMIDSQMNIIRNRNWAHEAEQCSGCHGALKMQDKLRPGRFADVLRYQTPFDKIIRGRRGL